MFDSESAANEYFEKKLEEIKNLRIRKLDWPNKRKRHSDPVMEKITRDNEEVFPNESILQDEYVMDNKRTHKEMERIES